MLTTKEVILLALNTIRCIPHILIFYVHKNKHLINADVIQSYKLMERDYKYKQPLDLLYLLTFCRQFRNLFYYRTRPFSSLLNILCPQLPNLQIATKTIGGGLAIIHGYATAIGAESIGENCVIFQQVTIGGTIHGAPTLLNNVKVYAGAVLIGKITIGNNVVIGANATVYTNIPDNCTVLPGTSKVMRWKKSDKNTSIP